MLQKYLVISAFLYKFLMPYVRLIVIRNMVCFFVHPMHSLTAWWGLSCIMVCFKTGMVDIYVLDLPLPMCGIVGLILQNPNTLSQNYTTT